MQRSAATLTLPIAGMHCAGCAGRIERALRSVPGVEQADVNVATSKATITLDGTGRAANLLTAVEAAGYSVPAETTSLSIGGLSCASCIGRVETALCEVPGVVGAEVNMATGRATVRHLAGTASLVDLRVAVAAAGYEAREAAGSTHGHMDYERHDHEDGPPLRRDVLIAGLLCLPLVVLAMGGHVVPALHHWIERIGGMRASAVVQGILAALVLAGPGRSILRTGFVALVQGRPEMNALVAIGASAAFGYSLVATLAPSLLPSGGTGVYFESAGVIIAFVLLGRMLETEAKGRAGDAIRQLAALAPATARVVAAGAERDVPLGDIRLGDIVRVRPGERVATDGLVTAGRSHLDESMVTGESRPVPKGVGDAVVGGTLNTTGGFDFRVTGVGAETVLSRIARMVEEAQGAKLPIQALVDRVTGWFVPAVLAAAAVTFFVWLVVAPPPALPQALAHAVAVLLIACPCAMGLATPISIMVGTGRGARLGLLVRSGRALQALGEANIVAFDKTGTLTEGRPALTDVAIVPGFSRRQVLSAVASLEARSEHPLAAAIVAAAHAERAATEAVEDFQAVAGFGVSGRVAGRRVDLGSLRYLDRLGLREGPFAAEAATWVAEGKTAIHLSIDGEPAALLAVSDPPRAEAAAAIAGLARLGLQVAMISGDDARTAGAVARRLGIAEVVGGVPPEGKVAALRAMRAGRGRVAFVGDGINDAPALAEAEVGIAIGTGADIAKASADVILIGHDVRGVVAAVALSRAVMRNIKENLGWAFGYNIVLIPVAAGLLAPFGIGLSPMLASGAMASSSVLVVVNALRLRRFQPPALRETMP